MSPGISPYYFCPTPAPAGTTAPSAPGTGTPPECIEIEDDDTGKYFNIKTALVTLVGTLAQKESRNLTDDARFEAVIIGWLISREIGYHFVNDQILKEIFSVHFEKLSNNPRMKFWRAKIALTLVNDIDNPYSREFLNLKFAQSGKPVFGIEIPVGKTEFSNPERMALLKKIYKEIIEPSGDDLLEADLVVVDDYLIEASVYG